LELEGFEEGATRFHPNQSPAAYFTNHPFLSFDVLFLEEFSFFSKSKNASILSPQSLKFVRNSLVLEKVFQK
jgi:hypothetical protein